MKINTVQHGTIKQHLSYLRHRQRALSLLETPTPAHPVTATVPIVAALDAGVMIAATAAKPKRPARPPPSEADIKVTRDLIRAGQLLKIEVLDHVIVGRGQRSSLRELGYFNW